MARCSVPYPYVDARRWGDGKDPYYKTDIYVSSANVIRDEKDIEANPSMIRLKEYIEYIKQREQSALLSLGLNYQGNQVQYNIFDATNFDKKVDLEKIQKKLQSLSQEYNSATEAFKKDIQKSLSPNKHLSNYSYADFYKLFEQALSGDMPSASQALEAILKPLQQECERISANHDGTIQNTAHALKDTVFAGYSKVLSYFISLQKDPNYKNLFTPEQQADLNTLKNILFSKELLRQTRKTIATQEQGGKFSVISRAGKVTIIANPNVLLTSIKQSLQQLNRKDIPKAIEKLLGKLGRNIGSRGFSGGTLSETFNYDLTYDYAFSAHDNEAYRDQSAELKLMADITTRLNDSIKRRRTVKTDLNINGYGASVKVGQKDQTKLDTRSSYYTFVNFIGQYIEGSPIAALLLKPENMHIVINTILKEGTFQSSALNEALATMAYAFFGATNPDFLVNGAKNLYFKSDLKNKTNLNENVLIINEEGQITLISAYLENIYKALIESYKNSEKSTLTQTTFSGASQTNPNNKYPELDYPHPATKRYNEVGTILQSIEVTTYIKTFQPVL